MLLNIEKAYPEIVKEISVSRFRQDHLSYEFISEAILKDKSVLYIKDYLFMDGSRKYSYHWQNEQGNLIPGGIMQIIGLMFQHFPIMYIWDLRNM